MYDNKIRISKDVIEKAQLIADEWGLKNPRVALEAVFRKYADEYMYGRTVGQGGGGRRQREKEPTTNHKGRRKHEKRREELEKKKKRNKNKNKTRQNKKKRYKIK